MIKCILRVCGSNTMNYSINYSTLFVFLHSGRRRLFRLNIVKSNNNSSIYSFYFISERLQAPFFDWILSNKIQNHIINMFILLYSGRRRLFPTEYCQKEWQFIELRFLLLLIAAAGVFVQLTIVENYEKTILFTLLFFCTAAAGAFFLANLVKHQNVEAQFPGIRSSAQIYWDVPIS